MKRVSLTGLTVVVLVALYASMTAERRERQSPVSFHTRDGGVLSGDSYGSGARGVAIVAHGGYSRKARWEPQARRLADAGFRVLVFDTRAAIALAETGNESECLYDPVCMAADVLAAVHFLRNSGATTVAVIGGSAGGGAAGQASVDANPSEIDRLVLLAPMAIGAPEKMRGRKIFITTRDDRNDAGPRLTGIREQYERAGQPKELLVLDGSAHGQLIFDTPQGEQLMREILRFLAEP